jgi:hypothetical protein
MLAFFARAHEFDVGLFSSLLRNLIELFFVGLIGFEVSDLDVENVRRPAVAKGVGALENGLGVRNGGWRCGMTDEDTSR